MEATVRVYYPIKKIASFNYEWSVIKLVRGHQRRRLNTENFSFKYLRASPARRSKPGARAVQGRCLQLGKIFLANHGLMSLGQT